MKKFTQYLTEVETDQPQVGDGFVFESDDGELVESTIVEILEDGVVIESDAQADALLQLEGFQLEAIQRYGAVGNSPGMGYSQNEDADMGPGDHLDRIENGQVGGQGGLAEELPTPPDANHNDPLLSKAIDDAAVPAMEADDLLERLKQLANVVEAAPWMGRDIHRPAHQRKAEYEKSMGSASAATKFRVPGDPATPAAQRKIQAGDEPPKDKKQTTAEGEVVVGPWPGSTAARTAVPKPSKPSGAANDIDDLVSRVANKITKSGIIYADDPGHDIRQALIALKQRPTNQLIKRIFKKMQQAGLAGDYDVDMIDDRDLYEKNDADQALSELRRHAGIMEDPTEQELMPQQGSVAAEPQSSVPAEPGSAAAKAFEGKINEAESPVSQAIVRRIISQRIDLLSKYGPERVGDAVDHVASSVGKVEEIGSSDVSGWVRQVEQELRMGESLEEMRRRSGLGSHRERGKEHDVEESALQAYIGTKKYGEEGMAALQQAGRQGASKEKMAKIRAQYDKLDEVDIGEAEYQGRDVPLGKPMQGDVKKFKVYVRDPKTGNVKKVNFGDKTMRIKKSNPARRKSFRARHNCDNPGPRTKARYWSCRKW